MERIEFFTSNNEVWYKNNEGMFKLTEDKTEIIDYIFSKIETLYSDSFKALSENYRSSAFNLSYFKYLCVRRFCKCNFGNLDETFEDITSKETFNFERVECPLRGECRFEGIICQPKFNSKLSTSEMRVMRLVYDGDNIYDIAKSLYISPNTVKNHIKNVYLKLKIHKQADFIKYANEHNLFNL